MGICTRVSSTDAAALKEPFKTIPLIFTAQDQACITGMNVQKVCDKACYRVRELIPEAMYFFSQVGENTPKDCQKAAKLLSRITQHVLCTLNKRAASRNYYTDAFVIMRSFVPDAKYETPR